MVRPILNDYNIEMNHDSAVASCRSSDVRKILLTFPKGSNLLCQGTENNLNVSEWLDLSPHTMSFRTMDDGRFSATFDIPLGLIQSVRVASRVKSVVCVLRPAAHHLFCKELSGLIPEAESKIITTCGSTSSRSKASMSCAGKAFSHWCKAAWSASPLSCQRVYRRALCTAGRGAKRSPF